MPILNELASAVKRRRLEMGLSQERLAALADLSRATINDLETGKLLNLSLTRAERLANVLGFGLGVTGSRRGSTGGDALQTAVRVASVSFGSAMPADTLRESLLRGYVPPPYIPHLRALLDEAPIGVLSDVAAQLEQETGITRREVWSHMRRLAATLACTRDIWS